MVTHRSALSYTLSFVLGRSIGVYIAGFVISKRGLLFLCIHSALMFITHAGCYWVPLWRRPLYTSWAAFLISAAATMCLTEVYTFVLVLTLFFCYCLARMLTRAAS